MCYNHTHKCCNESVEGIPHYPRPQYAFPHIYSGKLFRKMHNNCLHLEDHVNGPHSFQQKMVSIHFPATTEPNYWQTISKNYPCQWGLHVWSTNFPAYDSFSLAYVPHFLPLCYPCFKFLPMISNNHLDTTPDIKFMMINSLFVIFKLITCLC